MDLEFVDNAQAATTGDSLMVVGRKDRLLAADVRALVAPFVSDGVWRAMINGGETGADGRLATSWREETPTLIAAGILPEPVARANSPSRAWSVPVLIESLGRRNALGIVFAPDDPTHLPAQLMAAARALPTWTARAPRKPSRVTIGAMDPIPPAAAEAARAVRRTTDLVDRPTNVLGVDAFVATAQRVAKTTGAACLVVRGTDLRDQGFGGLWSVGKAAREMPALVVLDYAPTGATQSLAWVGKGIVYDTGGLSIKSKTGMPGMKMDMAGAAAVLAAFESVIALALPVRLTAVLCLAENAVGPDATRPDDVITLKSGRLVEVNNTDAEGRLVLADGLAWVAQHRKVGRIVDIATLTGAQMAAVGKRVGGLYCPDESFELEVLSAGRLVGEPFHPLPVFPEFHRREFRSHVADLKNSVADRENAQSSCAAWFLQDSLEAVGNKVPWAHLDVCGPAMTARGRGTGFGTGLLLALAGAFTNPPGSVG